MREIITLQLGQQSNYLATHFWNAQESYFTYSPDEEPLVNHDVHWRPGIGADGSETFTPRTVIYDLKGGFGSMRKINALYDVEGDASSSALWNGPTVVHTQDPIAPSIYQQSLDAGLEPPELTTRSVRYWSDFSRVFFHPRSVVQLNEFELNSSLLPFERWSTGEDLFSSLDKEHDLVDRDFRPFVEEADNMQGIQLIATFDDAWGGFASDYLERLNDEYGKTPILVWGLHGQSVGISREKRLLRLANQARTLAEAYKNASLVVPAGVPSPLGSHVSLDSSSAWHTSAVLASALESVLLPSRLKDEANSDTLGGIIDLLNTMGRQTIANLQMSISPGEEAPDSSASDSRVRHASAEDMDGSEGLQLDLDFAPSNQLSANRPSNGFHRPRVFSQVVTTRGYPAEEADSDVEMEDDEAPRSRDPRKPVSRFYRTPLKFPILDSYPKIFKDDGGATLRHGVNVTASLTTDTAISDKLKLLRTTVTRSIGIEDREVLSNDLADMAEEYHEGWSSGTDEGDDD
ncbi:hypothetical protein VTK73DRAFT_1930 [Phialemonium thermophilum]|uniref:Uncharacterized protein n=1 Tax=Phialemonium thermophilum TaxID=223376 RepID=A0ABR3X7J0_9PEZI